MLRGELGQRMEERLAGGLDETRAGAFAALRGIKQPLVALVGGDASLDS